tara:strand:+ start:59237 stop:59647 length:411 start_codon:yes stop_codon:yes gene_type:complete
MNIRDFFNQHTGGNPYAKALYDAVPNTQLNQLIFWMRWNDFHAVQFTNKLFTCLRVVDKDKVITIAYEEGQKLSLKVEEAFISDKSAEIKKEISCFKYDVEKLFEVDFYTKIRELIEPFDFEWKFKGCNEGPKQIN